ncbi:MAG: WXG100 family type VII secretion target [Marmoricola sp.]
MREASTGGGGGSVFTPPQGSPGAIRGAAARVKAKSDSMHDLAKSARSAHDGRLDTWSGAASNAFNGFAGRVDTLGRGLTTPLTEIGAATDDYADALDTAQKQIAAAKERYDHAVASANAIRERVNSNPNRTEAQVRVAQQEVDAHDRAAQDAVDDARRGWKVYHAACERAVHQLEGTAKGSTAEVESSPLEKLLEHTQPYRGWNDSFQSVWNGLGLGSWTNHANKLLHMGLGEAEETLSALRSDRQEMQVKLQMVEALESTGQEVLPQTAAEAERAASGLDRTAGLERGLQRGIDQAKFFEKLEGVTKTVDGLGFVGDLMTIADPEDSGAMGNVDRAAAGVNGALLVANMTMDEIPVAGEVVMAGTGVYLAGDYLYHHWGAFHDACDYVGHHVADLAVDTGQAFESGYHDVASGVSDVAHGAEDVASSAKDKLGGLADDIGGMFS